MKITLKTDSLREFTRRAQLINSNTILPILSNLKLEYVGEAGQWQIVKNNTEAIIIGKVDALGDKCTVLLDERILLALLVSAGETITINIREIIIINDGSGDTELPIENAALFPENPTIPDTAPIQITTTQLRAVKIASSFTSQDKSNSNFEFVHIANGNIFAFHNSYFYIAAEVGAGLPEICLRKAEAEMITSTDGVGFIDMDRHHVFFNSGYVYIFTKSEAKVLNITGVTDRLELPGKDMVIKRDEFINFCDLANVVCETPLAECVLSPNGSGLKLSLKDVAYSRATERVISCQGEPDTFAFNSRLMSPILKAIPYEVLNGKTLQNNLIFKGANEWFCFVGAQK